MACLCTIQSACLDRLHQVHEESASCTDEIDSVPFKLIHETVVGQLILDKSTIKIHCKMTKNHNVSSVIQPLQDSFSVPSRLSRFKFCYQLLDVIMPYLFIRVPIFKYCSSPKITKILSTLNQYNFKSFSKDLKSWLKENYSKSGCTLK